MRILAGVLGFLLGLPFVLVAIFQQNFPRSQQLAVGLIGLMSEACCVIAA